MKLQMYLRHAVWTGSLLILIVVAGVHSARAQTVIPQACVQPNHQATTTMLTAAAAVGASSLSVPIPTSWASLIINPGAATEERIPVVRSNGSSVLLGLPGDPYRLAHAHSSGEIVVSITEVEVVFGYTNTSNAPMTIPRGITTQNYFSPGPVAYNQPSQFLSGIHGNVFTVKFGAIAEGFTWFLNGSELKITSATARCATITYQGRLSDAGASANGNYDLQFIAYDTATNGIAQTDRITVSDVAVTNGTFTVPLYFAHTFTNSDNARFFEIAVKPSGGFQAFTIMTPRQPITDVPFAINAQTAVNAKNAENLGGVVAEMFFKTSGGTVDGTLKTTGDINVGQSLIVSGTISSSCRTGFIPFAGGRLCVSAMQQPATFYGANGALRTCQLMQARVGGSADVMLTFADSSFNYFDGISQGWLADHFGDNSWGSWIATSRTPDFDGPALNVYTGGTGGTPPSLPYRCVY